MQSLSPCLQFFTPISYLYTSSHNTALSYHSLTSTFQYFNTLNAGLSPKFLSSNSLHGQAPTHHSSLHSIPCTLYSKSIELFAGTQCAKLQHAAFFCRMPPLRQSRKCHPSLISRSLGCLFRTLFLLYDSPYPTLCLSLTGPITLYFIYLITNLYSLPDCKFHDT